ncbi:uncharacterized protein C8Q71DRAFT_131623 [Rhodofomes roseus]|uniref:Uncharacterized protein n=1 Tax=Rhodofomes roseus TaxID=34475 RepID=A0ABQ8KBI9_9APHY|nr:uncharacterized protein C8Q71DRAFT_131623 [Rhodofomes roseus]KAH9834915.1 hypothetical protein C8Q71DRAFT_131623 [Rhodofomes roseus]
MYTTLLHNRPLAHPFVVWPPPTYPPLRPTRPSDLPQTSDLSCSASASAGRQQEHARARFRRCCTSCRLGRLAVRPRGLGARHSRRPAVEQALRDCLRLRTKAGLAQHVHDARRAAPLRQDEHPRSYPMARSVPVCNRRDGCLQIAHPLRVAQSLPLVRRLRALCAFRPTRGTSSSTASSAARPITPTGPRRRRAGQVTRVVLDVRARVESKRGE